ncbi:MAG: ATP-binding protein [Verrucomicrobiae bacterium]|nr:ATP-binding protein [Verrucomicrobiae bacterium]
MIQREIGRLARRMLREYPAAALVGPRQSGKTTLAKQLGRHYFDMEQAEDRLRLDLTWDETTRSRQLLVLDEAQAWPELFPRLRGAIDAKRNQKGRFLLLGSVSPALMKQVSESLAGRMALCEMTPFIFPEIGARRADDLWLRGGYPDGGILSAKRYPMWQKNYLTLLAQRDLPSWGLPAKPALTERFFKMLACCQGNLFNASQLGQSLGVSYHTIQTYLDFLENAFLIRRLPPFHAQVGKRLLKSPKIYWRDSGLLHALHGIQDRQALLSQPWVGQSWEGWIIEQILATLQAQGRHHEACFLRTSDGLEADLILQMGKSTLAVEIKLSTQPNPHDFVRLEKAAALTNATQMALICRTTKPVFSGKKIATNLDGFLRYLKTL